MCVCVVTGVVCRADESSSDSVNTAEQGMKLLSKILSIHSENIQSTYIILAVNTGTVS